MFNAFVPLGLSAFVAFGLSAFAPFGLSAFVPLFLAGWKPPRAGEVLPKFSILSITLAISSFVQPPSAGSNNPTTTSPAVDPGNPSPQSGPSLLSRCPQLQSPPPE